MTFAKVFSILTILIASSSALAETTVLCPERYTNGSLLMDGDVIRYENGARLKDGMVWRYTSGNRLVDGDIWRYENGNRLIDAGVWRYENGNRLLDGSTIRYENGNRLRDDGLFLAQNGDKLGGSFLDHEFRGSDGTSMVLEMTPSTQRLLVILSQNGNRYEIAYAPNESQPSRITCYIRK